MTTLKQRNSFGNLYSKLQFTVHLKIFRLIKIILQHLQKIMEFLCQNLISLAMAQKGYKVF